MNPSDFVSSTPFESTVDAGDEQGADAVDDAGATNHAGAEGAEPTTNLGRPSPTSSTIRDALLSTDPDPPLESVESPFDPENGGVKRVFRGLMKMAGTSGVPAVVDVALGLLEVYVDPPTGARPAPDRRPADAGEQGDDVDAGQALAQIEAMEER